MTTLAALLPPNIEAWFDHRGWRPHAHQLEMVEAGQAQANALLIAPTGAGKTLAGFLPTLTELAERPRHGLHTLYISPLKALAVDIHRNLETPIAELRLPIRAETRTGDTPETKRKRQRASPPQILMTTPESLALLLSYPDAADFFRPLRTIVLDELHALAGTKRGDLLSLGLARLASLAPAARRVGLSATVADPDPLVALLSKTGRAGAGDVRIIRGREGAPPVVKVLETRERLPWSGTMAVHAMAEVYERIREVKTAIVFVNTRAQAELCFQELWRVNDDNLAIGLHHGSLAPEQRRKIETAMAAGSLRAVVATSSLDLGLDWGSVDLVVQVGAPKGASRLMQRIGRSNHRLDEPSQALLVPGNRFEHLECRAAIDAVNARTLDGDPIVAGGLDVLSQHVLGTACSAPFDPDELYLEVCGAAPYADLSRKDFDDVVQFVATGGYALGAYERFRRLQLLNGKWHLADKQFQRSYRMNVGTIVEAATLKVRLNRGPVLGEIEENFVSGLTAGDTFIFGGQMLRFVGIQDMAVNVVKGGEGVPKVPVYAGGRMPLTTHLADRVRAMLADPSHWPSLPDAVREWLELQRWASVLPDPHGLLVESFPRGDRQYLVAYCFEGRQAHQTLGMLLSKRMERMGLSPMGFVATDYVLSVWSLRAPTTGQLAELLDEDLLGDDLDAWMDESSLLKRTFRNVAIISGLIERQLPGQRKNTRQITFSSDLIYEVLKRHEPDHVLLRATRHDAGRGLTDVRRVAELLARAKGRIQHVTLDRVSPLAVPVLLEIGREAVYGSARDDLLELAEADLVRDATEGTMPARSSVQAVPPAPRKPRQRKLL